MASNPFHQELMNKTQAAYDRISRWYDLVEGNWEKPARNAGLHWLAAAPGEKILEIGTGTGSACLRLAVATGSNGLVIGVDLSNGMLRMAHRRLQKPVVLSQVCLLNGDACALPVRSSSMDAVYSSFTLELFVEIDILNVLRECRRVLKPGGRICLVSLTASGKPSLPRRLYEWCHRHMPDVVDCRPIHVKEYLNNTGFKLQNSLYTHLWRIPIEIVLANSPG